MPLILLLVLLVLFSPLAIDIYLPAIPQMAEQLGAEVTLMQGTITWFLFSMGLGQLLVGPLADRYGRKPIALGGVLLYGLSALAAGFAASLGELMLARVLQGFGACATSVAAFSVVRDSYGPKKSGQIISYLNGAICFIPALAPLLGAGSPPRQAGLPTSGSWQVTRPSSAAGCCGGCRRPARARPAAVARSSAGPATALCCALPASCSTPVCACWRWR